MKTSNQVISAKSSRKSTIFESQTTQNFHEKKK